MPSYGLVALLLFAGAAESFAAPRYIRGRAKPISFVAAVASNTPEPAPQPAPSASPEPRLGRIAAQAYTTGPAAPPPAYQPAPSIDSEAIASLSSQVQSGGGFLPLTLRNSIRERAEAEPAPSAPAADGLWALPSAADLFTAHNRDQGGRPADPAGRARRRSE